MEALFSIVKAAKYTVDPTARQLGYIFKHKAKFLNLQTKVQDLEGARQRLQQSVEAANRNGEMISDDVQRWLTEVDEKISEQAAKQLREEEEKATKRCFLGFCPDFKSRYQLSRKADKEADAITQLLTQKDAFNTVSYLPSVEVTDIIRPVKEYEAFKSRSGAFDEVMAALEDDTVSIIGVYGIGGVGKTTLVKEVAGQAKKKLSFDEVVFVAVTQSPNTVNIQNEIANKLGLKLDNDSSVDVRAARLRDRLKRAKKVLIILDDIWEEQEVDTLGIPTADQHKGCKILITSRKLVVLKLMSCQKSLPIDVLKEDEAWNLFKNVAGHIAETSDLQSTAMKVAQKCAGLLLAITTVAKALKHKENLYEWEDALERLKPSEINYRGISGAVYSAIEMSYTYLETEERKYTFLLCSTMGHNVVIEDLLKYCRGLDLFHGLDTIEKARNRVLTLVSDLKDSSLLLDGFFSQRFYMHDVVCDVAISIASRDHRWLALGKEDVFEEWSNEDTMRNSRLLSLHYAKVSELPDELECPNLTFFSMHGSVEVPDYFFKGMQRLRVLEFAQTHFTTLPSSIGSLKTLCLLRLIDCDLEDIVILGELRNLEILDLRRSRMKVLPKEIGQLTKLKLLDFSHFDNEYSNINISINKK
ncbi:disease resistance protein At4g27190-like [Hibiscus syriacus]|uniref:disease resistance protein At4g27190-like n=1 Tax=Hibiscus syriacus TaxID=106335 RepID=UPI001922D232|nr:disease resistance protein At4g27190-like [Hibiscus syriacus]